MNYLPEGEDLGPEDFGEIMEGEGVDFESENPEDLKRKINVVEEELDNLEEEEWSHAKHLLKYGLAAWVFGLSVFFFILVSFRGLESLWNAPGMTYSLLIIAGAIPAIFTSFFIQRYRKERTELGEVKSELLDNYEGLLLEDEGGTD